jgi:hypothetical protein
MLVMLDKAFIALHTLLMVFNMVGWAWRRTRVLHLIVLSLTAASWFILGASYGWGYCICTDWHFQVRERLGYNESYTSYLQLLAAQWFGFNLDSKTADWIAGTAFALIVLATAATWWRVWMKQKHAATVKPAELPH